MRKRPPERGAGHIRVDAGGGLAGGADVEGFGDVGGVGGDRPPDPRRRPPLQRSLGPVNGGRAFAVSVARIAGLPWNLSRMVM